MQRPLRVQDVSPTAAAWLPYSWPGILSPRRGIGHRFRFQSAICKGAGFLIQERDRFPPREFSRLVRIGSPVPTLTLNWAVDGFAWNLRVGTFASAYATPPRSYKFGISRPSGRTIFMRRRKFVPLLVRWPLAVIASPILIVFLSQPPYLPSMAGLLASPAHFSISPLSFFTSR